MIMANEIFLLTTLFSRGVYIITTILLPIVAYMTIAIVIINTIYRAYKNFKAEERDND